MKNKFICIDDIEVTENMKEEFAVYWYHYGDMDGPDKYQSQDWVAFRWAYNSAQGKVVHFEKLYKSALNEAKQQYTWRSEDSECGIGEIKEGLDTLEYRIITDATKD